MIGQRDERVDFFRGLALVFIFWDHIPGSVFGDVTVRNFGLSDAAEIFVFLAGYSAGAAYVALAARDGALRACARALGRAWTLYVAHIFVLVLLSAAVLFANSRVETRDFIGEMHLGHLLHNTELALFQALTLQFRPHLMDPLPLYIVLLALFAAILPLFRRFRIEIVAVSASLYLAVQAFGWNLPTENGYGWFFNPFAWQFLFVLGAAAATRPAGAGPGWWERPAAIRAALAYLAFSCLWALSWRWPALHDAVVPLWLGELVYPISKTDLSPWRLLHFLALTVVVAAWLKPGAWLARPAAAHLRRMGRFSLEVFCLTVILAPLADMTNTLAGDGYAVQAATAVGGVVAMAGLALLIEWARRPQARGAPAVAPARP